MQEFQQPKKKDQSLRILFYTNVIFILIALYEHLSLLNLVVVYLIQSIIIGLVNFVRILRLKRFSTEGYQINGRQPKETEETKLTTAFFFLAHYGLFHLVYFILILGSSSSESDFNWPSIGLMSLFFIVNHFTSYFSHYAEESSQVPNIGKIMFRPYVRVLPMHLIVIFGFFAFQGDNPYNPIVLIAFLLLKTAADLLGHVFEHKLKSQITVENKN